LLRYLAVAAALKCFSLTPQTRRMYRWLGNTLGQRMRIRRGLDANRLRRAREILALCRQFQAVQSGDTLLELGTGWIHWESTIIRLLYDVEITLFDTWDNRQFEAYQRYFGQLEQVIDRELNLDAAASERAHGILQIIAKAQSFNEIYDALGFSYVVSPDGSLAQFPDQSFSLIFSCNVLEHVERSILPGFTRDIYRLLKPGGYSIQTIDPGDHLAYYDKHASRKNYLRYSDTVWKRFFENNVQYFNRVQRPQWLELFRQAGLELVEEQPHYTDIGSIKIDKSYAGLDRRDLECVVLTAVHKRPAGQ
jgi:SAM-dependent methyltransferase